jgi:hypothetical protein
MSEMGTIIFGVACGLVLGVVIGKEYGQWKTIKYLERDWKVKLEKSPSISTEA